MNHARQDLALVTRTDLRGYGSQDTGGSVPREDVTRMSGRSVLARGLRLCDFKKGEMVVLSVRKERQENYRKNKTDAQREAEMSPGAGGGSRCVDVWGPSGGSRLWFQAPVRQVFHETWKAGKILHSHTVSLCLSETE